MDDHARVGNRYETALPENRPGPTWANAVLLIVWLAAAVVAFIPFAFDTSPWDAVTLRVPGNQGNWWHFLAGAPFFLAFPMLWLRLRALLSTQPTTVIGRRLIWVVIGLSGVGTILVETPFLLHLAGTRGWPSFSILCVGLGILIASAVILLLRRRHISPTRACLAGLDTAYLANAALCLVVYNGATGDTWSKAGWLVTLVIFWPIGFELVWIYFQSFQTQAA